ncbi:hypothetical protein EZV62_012918 [Acer yangbiense]|uniref:Uncharacterized protein n=1 Tax=Acer yangbiense TaxID=1000413 RepID=A0A5C7HXL0_9ROSI|nr:hypothetical protein EZV62_012918 [Acer yangbiense]
MQPLCHDSEHFALLQFKASIVINKSASSKLSAYPKVASWKLEEEGNGDCCLWDGVKCNEETGHVIRLDLSSSCLYGSINSTTTLFHLVHLQWLSLADNDFNNSRIPSQIINLLRLSHLNLSSIYSSFSGQIPSQILELSQLEFLDLSHNKLKLHKPSLKSLVEKLTNLKVLKLIGVYISSSIPHTLANLSSLTCLSLAHCGLEGELPVNVLQLSNLQFLDVQSNYDLIGFLPNSIGDLKFLSYLDVSGCRLSGTIPPSLGNLTKHVYLDLSSNNFSGQVPNSLSNLIQLNHMDISHNGGLGQNSYSLSWMSKLTKLTYVGLTRINLVGEIPSWLMNLTQLTNLKMNGNQLIG